MRPRHEVIARKRRAISLISRAKTPAPIYGSTEWLALSFDDPRYVATIVIAAESWAVDGDDLEGRLEQEVIAERAAFKQTEDAEYQARAAAHKASAPRPAKMSFAQRRAAQLEAAAPRPGDFPGRKESR